MDKEILKMEGITKVYPNGIVANKNVDFSIREGEIHALAGENGAGKSTLMKILFGQEEKDDGRIILNGEEVDISSSQEAIDLGIGMVHQHFMLVPSMTVAENMVLGMEPIKKGLIDREEAVRITEEVSNKYNLYVDPLAKVRDLPVGIKQRVEILKTLLRGAKILILDEPTAVLTPQETEKIFLELKKLREMGHTIIFISHKLKEIKEICDRITIMRDGQLVGVRNVSLVSEQEISKLMVGRDIESQTEKTKFSSTEIVLEVENLDVYDKFNNKLLDNVNLELRTGEILGVAGIEGNGQNELSELITGLRSAKEKSIKIYGQDISSLTIRQIRELGVSHVSQDRMTYGTVSDGTIYDNIIADRYYKKENSKGFFISHDKLSQKVDALIEDYDIACENSRQVLSMLSGGNMQKVVVAREFSLNPSIIIANQPTRGIDVGSAELVRNALIELRNRGSAILLISADLIEVIELSDKVIVLQDGKINALLNTTDNQTTPEELGEYMLGIKKMDKIEWGGESQ